MTSWQDSIDKSVLKIFVPDQNVKKQKHQEQQSSDRSHTRSAAVHSDLRGWQNLSGQSLILLQNSILGVLLDINR